MRATLKNFCLFLFSNKSRRSRIGEARENERNPSEGHEGVFDLLEPQPPQGATCWKQQVSGHD